MCLDEVIDLRVTMIEIERFKQNEIGTWGRLYFGDFECFTFEPVGDDEIRRGLDRRIPEGIYNMRWHDSPRFKRKLPHLYNEQVPKDRYILIHSGNLPEHTEGCILLGYTKDSRGVFNSRTAFNEFMEKLRAMYKDDLSPVELRIINNF